jgi:16S rRNA (guanine966-N2)-methyltransferase
MRIVAGEFRSRTLRAPDTEKTRPTTDRARETLFNVLNNVLDFEGLCVLDLFAGSGALGLEALSRGAAHTTFVEQDRKALEALNANIATLKVQERSRVVQGDVFRALPNLTQIFDVILADPPYADTRARVELPAQLLRLMTPESVLVLEHRSGDEVTVPAALEAVRELKAGEAGFSILRWKS